MEKYNSLPPHKLTLSDENSLIEIPPVTESKYIRKRKPKQWAKVIEEDFIYFLIEYFIIENSYKYIKRCDDCQKYYISKTLRGQRFCSSKCRQSWNNRKRIESGEHKEYKRRKRAEGACKLLFTHKLLFFQYFSCLVVLFYD
jgi:hypothetical protein